MNKVLLLLSLGYLVSCESNMSETSDKAHNPLPSFGVYTCKWCLHKDTAYFYYNLDTNSVRNQNIKKFKH